MQVFRQNRKIIENLSHPFPDCLGMGQRAQFQIFLHGKVRNDFPALRYVGNPVAGPLIGFHVGKVPVTQPESSRLHRQQPDQAFQQRRFPHAIAAENRQLLRGIDGKRHIVHDSAFAVTDGNRIYFQHIMPPPRRRPSNKPGSLSDSASLPQNFLPPKPVPGATR